MFVSYICVSYYVGKCTEWTDLVFTDGFWIICHNFSEIKLPLAGLLTIKYLLTLVFQLYSVLSCLLNIIYYWVHGIFKKWANGYQAVCWPFDSSTWNTIIQAGVSTKAPVHRGTRAGRHRRISVIIMHARHGPARPIESMVNTNNMTQICLEDKADKLEFAVSLINCQSVCNKTNERVDYVKDHDVDVLPWQILGWAIMNRTIIKWLVM